MRTDRRPLRALLRGPAVALAAAAAGAAVTGCASGSVASPPAGVDTLVVPTPSPDPADFGPLVTNAWFPLTPGETLRYQVLDLDGEHPLTVTVTPGPRVAGVRTTARVSSEQGHTTTDWYAQDRRGNVWWFGRAGAWRAGRDGARAGLAVPAVPRLGDGWATGYARGTVLEVAEVTALDGVVAVPEGEHDPVLVLEVRSPATGTVRELDYARGTGLVEDDTRHGGYRVTRLVQVVGG